MIAFAEAVWPLVALVGGIVAVCFLAEPLAVLWVVHQPPADPGVGFDDNATVPEEWVALEAGICPVHGRTAHALTTEGVGCCECAEAAVGGAL